jgi:histidinol-phosphatase
MLPEDWLEFLNRLADEADRIALHFFKSQAFSVDHKPDLTPVTEADRDIEHRIRRVAGSEHPDLGILGEEEGESGRSDGPRLIIDPIDATQNFIRGIPAFATLLAIEEDEEILAGVVSASAMQARWCAARGRGATKNGQPIRASVVSELAEAQLFHGDLSGRVETAPPPGTTNLMRRTRRTRGFGDFYQHVLVAEGAGEISIDPELRPWDAAPLLVIVEEAGGRATSIDGKRDIYAGSLVATNGILHDEVLSSLSPANL